MKARVTLFLVVFFAFGLVVPSLAWDGATHQRLYELALELISNDVGSDFDSARSLLDHYHLKMLEAVIAPDTQQLTLVPPTPNILHGWDAWGHCGFGGPRTPGAYDLGQIFAGRAVDLWRQGRTEEAFFNLGCLIHLVQDCSWAGHSNTLNPKLLIRVHSSFEGWVNEKVKSGAVDGEERGLWRIEYGGLYVRRSFVKEGKTHWPDGLAGWVDVAAHLSYDWAEESSLKDRNSTEFLQAATYQFVQAQRTVAGLLLEYFRLIGVVPQPRFSSVDLSSTSPDGKSQVWLEDGRLAIKRGVTTWYGQPENGWPLVPQRIQKAWFVSNVEIVLEGEEDDHRVVVPGMPEPNRGAAPTFMYFGTYGDLSYQQVKEVVLSK